MLDKCAFWNDKGKSIGFFGLGRSNLSLLELLVGTDIPITLRSDKEIDRSLIPTGLEIRAIYEGDAAFRHLTEDTLVLSPSVRRERAEFLSAQTRGTRLTSDAELFFETVDTPVYAISGSDGKSTTATLTHLLLGGTAHGTALCGNVGRPMLNMIKGGFSRYVTELSSFMLRYFSPNTRRAALTNITPNHLDWHLNFEEYCEAKLTLYKGTREPVINLDDRIVRENIHSPVFSAVSTDLDFKRARSLLDAEVYYTLEDGYIKRNGEPYLATEKIRRREAHNLKNFMTALALTDGVGSADREKIAVEFDGLAHRCEEIITWCDVKFVNSSIDTSPDRCATTLRSINTPAVVILGGRDKGVPFTPLIEPLKKIGRAAVIFGECREEIEKTLKDTLPCYTADSMDDAVRLAIRLSRCGDTVILSPAATSYDRYGSFEERGEDFKRLVKKYCEEHS